MTDQAATQRELDQLREDIRATAARIDNIDDHGTRGMGVVAIQVAEVIKDLADLKKEVNDRFDGHQQEHRQVAAQRAAGRRWMVSTALAGGVLLVAILALVTDIAFKLHGH